MKQPIITPRAIGRARTTLLCVVLFSFADTSLRRVVAQQPVNKQLNRGGVPLRLREPRIKPIEEKDWTAVERELLAPIKTERGSVPNIYGTLARHPKLFAPRLTFGRYIQRGSTVPARDREILILRIAWLSSGEYEWSAHTTIGIQNGLTKEDIQRIAKGPQAHGWSPFDATLVRAADELYQNMFIGDPTWKRLAKRYDTHQMMDLVMTVGGYHMLAMALNSFGVRLEQDAAGFPTRAGTLQPGPNRRGGIPIRLSRPRIPPTPESDWSNDERELLSGFKQQRGYVMNVYGTLTRHPQMYRPWLAFARYILRESSLPAREREMLICRIAWLASGEYEWAAHKSLGKDAGLTDAEITRLSEGPDAKGWRPIDGAIVIAVDELHYDALISDATWTALARRFDTRQLMDLVFTVGAYKMLAMALNSFGAQLDKGMIGFETPANRN
ncbi:MAG: carboxymuconolactone decarboxylase family protein [Acidobacteriota bacterium]